MVALLCDTGSIRLCNAMLGVHCAMDCPYRLGPVEYALAWVHNAVRSGALFYGYCGIAYLVAEIPHRRLGPVEYTLVWVHNEVRAGALFYGYCGIAYLAVEIPHMTEYTATFLRGDATMRYIIIFS